ncbi:MAG: cohesin domain-containing protein [bacterium]|nr:cohesin domain-containing protein [bacterium]
MANSNEKIENIWLKNAIKIFVIISIIFVAISSLKVEAATLSLSSPSSNVLVGGTFDVSLILDTKDVPVNIIESELFFPPDKLQLAAPSFGESIIQMWPTPPLFSNEEGRVYLVGGKPSPGINTRKGLILTLTFRVVSAGQGEIRFGKKSSVLANDGAGTDVLRDKSSISFLSSFPPSYGPLISSPTHPDQGKWYQNNSPVFIWTRSSLTESYSYKIDHDPKGLPDQVADSSSTTVSYNNIGNGIWYFHLIEKASGVWGGASHYAVKIDNELPDPFTVNATPSKETISQSPVFRFSTSDGFSGLDHYEMKIVPLSSGEKEGVEFFRVSSPYQAVNWKVGRYLVVVRAIDNAGNTKDESVTVSSINLFSKFIGQEGVDLVIAVIPWFWVVIGFIIILIAFLIIFIRLWIKHREHLRHAFSEDLKKFFKLIRNKE